MAGRWLRLRPADPLKIILGTNYTWARSEGYSYGAPSNYRDNRFLPFVGATLDLSESRVSQMHSSIVQRLQNQLSERKPEFGD